jgi:prepilin-type processing-associated H-X9-DG protein
MLPYFKSGAMLSSCPSSKLPNWVPSSPGPPVRLSESNVSFAANVLYNTIAGDAVDGQATTPPFSDSADISLAQHAVPAETVVFGDSSGWFTVFSQSKADLRIELDAPFRADIGLPNFGRDGNPVNNGRYVARHSGGANLVFSDGHAKWWQIREVSKRNRNGVMYYFTLQDDAAL